MRAIILAQEDYSNVGNDLAVALRTHTSIEAGCLARHRHPFGYPHGLQLDRDRRELIDEWLSSADVVICKDDRITPDDFGYAANKAAVRLCTAEGIIIRDNRADHCARAVRETAARVAFMADVNFPELAATYIPAPINVDGDQFSYAWERPERPLICHSPSGNRRFKGTDAFFLPALDILRSRGLEFDVDVIEKVRWSTCIERKRRATIFFDQADLRIGTYGVSAIEAMALGVPTLAYISDLAKHQAGGLLDDCPVINVRPSAESIAEAIEDLLTNDLGALSLMTRRWCERTHGYAWVAEWWRQVLESVT